MANTPSRRRPHTRAVSDPSSPRTLSPPDLAAARSQPEDRGEQRRRRASQPHQRHQQQYPEQHQHQQQPPGGSLLQPRLAVVLNVPPPWHPWLFALRLASILPALWWGLPSILHLIILVLSTLLVLTSVGGRHEDIVKAAESEGGVTEATLASIWCFASGYLSFFFTDCLMSRWLINYTPQATMIRLITTNAINAYLTSTVLSLAGGFQDPRLLLPGWVGIATTLTVLYHIIHQKINIRKETSTSVNVFSIASYLSMLVLLAHMHTYQPDYPSMPLVTWTRRLWRGTNSFVAAQLKDYQQQQAQAELPGSSLDS